MEKFVYFFSREKAEGGADQKELLGGKGANLAQMAKLSFPVPPGFTISTETCTHFYKHDQMYPPQLQEEVRDNLSRVEEIKQAKFGDKENPLLLSVRSGARVSMPGMMDTVLNLGLTDDIIKKISKRNPGFAWNAYWRFIYMFADVVMGIEKEKLDEVLEGMKKEKEYKLNSEFSAEDWQAVVQRLKLKIKDISDKEIPQDPEEQLWQTVGAVFKSWNNPRAIAYRKLNKIPDDWGTAVNVQSMVFGNLSEDSGSGVGFTRNPATGEKKLYGEFLSCAQGEDVVAGIRTPDQIEKLEQKFPQCYQNLLKISDTLEKYYRDMQDIEFTIEDRKLWMLQTRTGKRTPQAALKMALDMEREGLIDKKTALLRIDPQNLESLFKPSFDPGIKREVLVKGLAASPGAAVGEVVFDSEKAVQMANKGHKVILVRTETSPDDIQGITAAQGILTTRGGMTSHAALVTRSMGKPGIVGCEAIFVDYKQREFQVGGIVVKEGDKISLDGSSGEVMLGELPTIPPQVFEELEEVLEWSDEQRRLRVYANADTSKQAKQAKELGAQGIGLCRTEHMFFGEKRLPFFQKMILAEDRKARQEYLEKIFSSQKGDFLEIFKIMEGLPVIIRLLDPPLHEFLPKDDPAAQRLKELNPMLGHRGVRLGITFPEIYEMQSRAVMEAACQLKKEGKKVFPEIMIPLILDLKEFEIMKEAIQKVCQLIQEKLGVKIDYKLGAMIELPRVALQGGKIAKEAEFFSFGTNDLTQTTLGISRDDAGRFLPKYLEKKIFKEDPFVSLDQAGVGELMKICKERARQTRSDIEIGICGEHGGDPQTVEFCHQIGLDYVSCSPFRVPIARLSAAQAKLKLNNWKCK